VDQLHPDVTDFGRHWAPHNNRQLDSGSQPGTDKVTRSRDQPYNKIHQRSDVRHTLCINI